MRQNRVHRISGWLTAGLLALTVGISAPVAEACPSCTEAVGQADQTASSAMTPTSADAAGTSATAGTTRRAAQAANVSRLGQAYSWSVLFMMGSIYLVMGGLGVMLWRYARREEAGAAAATAPVERG